MIRADRAKFSPKEFFPRLAEIKIINGKANEFDSPIKNFYKVINELDSLLIVSRRQEIVSNIKEIVSCRAEIKSCRREIVSCSVEIESCNAEIVLNIEEIESCKVEIVSCRTEIDCVELKSNRAKRKLS